ncbi:hypothetical protein EDD29_3761 [Actinocorallia herbida]|uniref:Uncharacterized protein n=1 Tax=Actinocorallia herbida TaxID=58109 RepID=A0A3N1CZI8_9ACTN|nr:hypothetical protein EDD29_3761 [Actinocorallia herbida]
MVGVATTMWGTSRLESKKSQRAERQRSAERVAGMYGELAAATGQIIVAADAIGDQYRHDMSVRLDELQRLASAVATEANRAYFLAPGPIGDAILALRDEVQTLAATAAATARLAAPAPEATAASGQLAEPLDTAPVKAGLTVFLSTVRAQRPASRWRRALRPSED